MGEPSTFRWVLVVTNIWKSCGWGSIIYLAALSNVDQEMYEAAVIDGATRFQRVWYITLPSIVPTITIMLILNSGNILNDNFDQVFNMMNAAVYKVSNVLGVYTYQLGLKSQKYAQSTAVGLFKNVIAFGLVLLANGISKKISNNGIW
jgi:putative aldouronate transport system permease protein